MNEPTINTTAPSEWDQVFPDGMQASIRSTTSSRHPGMVFTGAVYSRRQPLVACPACGGLRKRSSTPHSPHFVQDVLVDCQGLPC